MRIVYIRFQIRVGKMPFGQHLLHCVQVKARQPVDERMGFYDQCVLKAYEEVNA